MLCVHAVLRKCSLTKRAQSVPNSNRNHNCHLRKSASHVPNTVLNDANLTSMAFVTCVCACVCMRLRGFICIMCVQAPTEVKGHRIL